MQQTIPKPTPQETYRAHRTHRPVLMKRAQFFFVTILLLVDVSCTWLAYYLGYLLLRRLDPDVVWGILVPAGIAHRVAGGNVFYAAYVPAPAADQPSGRILQDHRLQYVCHAAHHRLAHAGDQRF
jgi:hypothetical protein